MKNTKNKKPGTLRAKNARDQYCNGKTTQGDSYKKHIGILFLLLVSIFMISLINAQVSLGTFKAGSDITLKAGCSNSTYTNLSYVSYPNGSFAFIGEYSMTKSGSNYYYTLTSSNALASGPYIYCYHCNLNGIDGNYCSDFSVTATGNSTSISITIFYIGILGLLIFFLFLCGYAFVSFDNLLNRVAMIGLSYLILIALSFISWRMALDFLPNQSFITSFTQLLFYILMWSALPLLIGGFAWYLLMLFKIKEIQRLMDKGFSEDEANRRIKGRHE